MKNLIINAFAFKKDKKGSENLKETNDNLLIEHYLKLSFVSLNSAKLNNPNDDVLFISNIEIPSFYKKLYNDNNINILKVEFNEFNFKENIKWNLAFYKLCALKYAINNLNYDNYLLVDSDTYIQNNLNNLWNEASINLMLYNIQHSLEITQALTMNDEYYKLYGKNTYLTNYGGEFICGNKNNLQIFLNECTDVFNYMNKRKKYTNHGDEFIISVASLNCKNFIKDAGAYIYRYWTDDFYLVSTNFYYNKICILHLPNEKNRGLIYTYNYFIKNKKLLTKNRMINYFSLPSIKKKYTIIFYKYKLKKYIYKIINIIRG